MTDSTSPDASIRRIVWRAVFLSLPLVAMGLGLPRVLRLVRPPPRAADLAAGIVPGVAPAQEEPPPPKPPESATPAQIEAAREAQVALGRAQKGWESSTQIAPREAREGEDGLPTRPFHGFGVEVESEPSAARVLADGEELGETPLVASLKCTPGSDVKVRVEKPPLPAWERTVRCRADALVKLSVKVGPAGGR